MGKIILLLMTLGLFILTGCGNSTPMGNDSDVKELVVQISKENLQGFVAKQLLSQAIPSLPTKDLFGSKIDWTLEKVKLSVTNLKDNFSKEIKREEEKIKKKSSPTRLRKLVEFKEYYARILEVSEIIDDSSFGDYKVTNVRPVSRNDKALKSTSKADLIISFDDSSFENIELPITYESQINGDGELYVEVAF